LAEVEVFDEQEEFAKNSLTIKMPFLNILDKGYQLTLDAKRNGQQPHFTEKNQKFKGGQTLYSAFIAVIRLGNE
jgi:hypothetical protein